MSARVLITAACLLLLPAALLAGGFGSGGSPAGSVPTLADAVSPEGTVASNGSLTGGTLRLEPLLPGGGGTSTSAQFRMTASIGQPGAAQSDNGQAILLTGFWTPAPAVTDRVFRNGFD